PDHNNKGKGGGNKAPSSHEGGSHQGGSHGGAVSRAPAVHQGGNHVASAPRNMSSHQAGQSSHQNAYHANKTAVSHENAVSHHDVVSHHDAVSHHDVVSHQTSKSHNISTKNATSHRAESRTNVAATTEHTRISSSEARDGYPEQSNASSPNTRASLYERNNTSREGRNHETAKTQERNNTRQPGKRNLQTRINSATKAGAFNHSLTRASAQGLMSHRLT